MASPPERQTNGVSIAGSGLVAVIIVSVILGSVLTVLVAWLYDKFLQDPLAKRITGSHIGGNSPTSLRQYRKRYCKETPVSHRRPPPVLMLPKGTDHVRPAIAVNGEHEQWTEAYLHPSPAFSQGKVSAVSSTPDLRLPHNETVKTLHVQPSAFKRWSLEAAEALRVSRLSTQAKRRSLRNSWNDGVEDLGDWMQERQKRFSGGFRSSSYYGPETDIVESHTAGPHDGRHDKAV